MATQEERKGETRARLLAAAAAVFAERGVEGASVDAIAEAAGRTSGALYGHFGSKEGLLLELLETWRSEVVASIRADLRTADTLDDRLLVVWRNFADPSGSAREWVQLEHELWRWATRAGNEQARQRLTERYESVWEGFARLLAVWGGAEARSSWDPKRAAVALIGTLIGLEMQHRLAPEVVTDELALVSIKALLGGT